MPTDIDHNDNASAPVSQTVAAEANARIARPPRRRVVRLALPRWLRKPLYRLDAGMTRKIDWLAAVPRRRRRAALGAAAVVNLALLTVLAVYGRVHIFVPNRPAESISVVFVDLPDVAPIPELRDPEIAPEPEPEPVEEPEITPEPEPDPVPEPEPEPEPEDQAPPEPEPEPEPEILPEPEPVVDLTPEPAFARPSEIEEAPMIPDEPSSPEAPGLDEPAPGDIFVEGEQTPAEEAPPLITVEPETRQAQSEQDAGEERPDDDEDLENTLGERGAGDDDQVEREAVAPSQETQEPAGDDMFDEEPVFGGRRFVLPQVELPTGETSTMPGTSGVVAIYCPEEFEDREKIAECAGRPEIRSGWRPGATGEDFSRAVELLKEQRARGVYTGDSATFGPEIARRMEQQRREQDLTDFRRSQDDVNDIGATSNDPAAGTRPDIGPAPFEPSWTRRQDPLVDQKDVDRLRRELEEAENAKDGD